jgi:Flp pilus assembly protein TadD
MNRRQRRAAGAPPGFAAAFQLHQAGRLGEAEQLYRQVLAGDPGHSDGLHMLGVLAGQTGRTDLAAELIGRAIARAPGCAAYHANLGNVLREQGDLPAATASFRRALALRPDFPEAHNNLGTALQELGEPEPALACFRRALALRPDYADALGNLGNALRDLGLAEAAVSCLRQAVRLRPGLAPAHHNLALALLACGEMAEGWQEYEWRWQAPPLAGSQRAWARPQWHGEAAPGRTLLIHAEQGFGDTLQFCRLAPLAASRFARVILEVPPPLVRLVRTLRGVDQVVAAGDALPAFDLQCPMLSLPRALGTTLEGIPATVPYLHADAAEAAVWRARLGGPGLRVGLAWAGNPRRHLRAVAAVDRRRSLPPELLAPLLAQPGPRFVSLQKDGPPALADAKVIDLMAEVHDFAATAALIENLDLVISVDTAVAHLAGALGRPVWLLDRFDSCWRWLGARRDSPWYPTLRRYRQPRWGDWASVVAEAAADLGRLTQTSPAPA